MIRHGDYTHLAKDYRHRAGYCEQVVEMVARYVEAKRKRPLIAADVGAGTGKLTENLSRLNLEGYAIEPNDAMRHEGMSANDLRSFEWLDGSAEATSLPDSHVDWVVMGSSFHWTDNQVALHEFRRILVPGGFFTAIWNPRAIEQSPFHQKIESNIRAMLPNLHRISSGLAAFTEGLEKSLLSENAFANLVYLEGNHNIVMDAERYLGAWRSVNDIQVQAGPATFQKILEMIEKEVSSLDRILVPYKTRAWTVQSTKEV